MTVQFPYRGVSPLELDDRLRVEFFDLPSRKPDALATTEKDAILQSDEAVALWAGASRKAGEHTAAIVERALTEPIGTAGLTELARGKGSVLLVVDDNSRPTPVALFIHCVLDKLAAAGVRQDQITIMTALGTHRPMTRSEMTEKLGSDVVNDYRCLNHDWADSDALVYLGETEQGAPVWVNRKVTESDLVIGIGAIMPIDICGYTGGGKILIPGLSGPETVNKMHWTRVYVPTERVVGHADNPIRESIDALARKAGLHFIVNVVLDASGSVVDAVAGDMTAAHREGCRRAERLSLVQVDRRYDIVVSDSYPFDIEFWQANKALDTAGHFMRQGGVIILVTPCDEGWSKTHGAEILQFGYRSIGEIRAFVESGSLKNSVVGVHMYQVSEAVVGKGTLIFVTDGLPRQEVEAVGFEWAATPQDAFARAVEIVGDSPEIAVLSNAARMVPVHGNAEG